MEMIAAEARGDCWLAQRRRIVGSVTYGDDDTSHPQVENRHSETMYAAKPWAEINRIGASNGYKIAPVVKPLH